MDAMGGPLVPPVDGWRVSSSYFSYTYVALRKTKRPASAYPQQRAPPPAPPADRRHISSSYSCSFGVRTGDSRVAHGCTTAAPGGQNLTLRVADYENVAGRHDRSTAGRNTVT